MKVLSIHNLEKHERDVLLFPPFNLEIESGEVHAIHSNLNIRVAILKMILGKVPILNGEIMISGRKFSQENNLYDFQVGICFFEDGLYPLLTVLDHIKFYQKLYGNEKEVNKVLAITQLTTLKNTRINKLTFSEKRRLHFALLLVKEPVLYILEEPDLNVDMETKRVLLNILDYLREKQKGILVLTSNMESAITMADYVYRLNEDGLQPIEMEEDSAATVEEVEEREENSTLITANFNKIPTKVNDKIILFDPPEIDYIESNDGQSNVFTKGEAFPSTFTMNELEGRLKPFGFFRCHRSYIVNLQKVREVITWTRNSYSLVLDDKAKSTIPLSKTKMAQLKEMLGLK